MVLAKGSSYASAREEVASMWEVRGKCELDSLKRIFSRHSEVNRFHGSGGWGGRVAEEPFLVASPEDVFKDFFFFFFLRCIHFEVSSEASTLEGLRGGTPSLQGPHVLGPISGEACRWAAGSFKPWRDKTFMHCMFFPGFYRFCHGRIECLMHSRFAFSSLALLISCVCLSMKKNAGWRFRLEKKKTLMDFSNPLKGKFKCVCVRVCTRQG